MSEQRITVPVETRRTTPPSNGPVFKPEYVPNGQNGGSGTTVRVVRVDKPSSSGNGPSSNNGLRGNSASTEIRVTTRRMSQTGALNNSGRDGTVVRGPNGPLVIRGNRDPRIISVNSTGGIRTTTAREFRSRDSSATTGRNGMATSGISTMSAPGTSFTGTGVGGGIDSGLRTGMATDFGGGFGSGLGGMGPRLDSMTMGGGLGSGLDGGMGAGLGTGFGGLGSGLGDGLGAGLGAGLGTGLGTGMPGTFGPGTGMLPFGGPGPFGAGPDLGVGGPMIGPDAGMFGGGMLDPSVFGGAFGPLRGGGVFGGPFGMMRRRRR